MMRKIEELFYSKQKQLHDKVEKLKSNEINSDSKQANILAELKHEIILKPIGLKQRTIEQREKNYFVVIFDVLGSVEILDYVRADKINSNRVLKSPIGKTITIGIDTFENISLEDGIEQEMKETREQIYENNILVKEYNQLIDIELNKLLLVKLKQVS